MKILFVSPTYPEDIHQCTSGIHQRMRMFLEALAGLGQLEILFYAAPHVDVSPARIARMEKLLEEQWGCGGKVFLCRRSKRTTIHLPKCFPLADRLQQWWFVHPYRYLIGSAHHRAALAACLDRAPDLLFMHRLNPLPALLGNRSRLPPVYFDMDDIEHRLFIRGVSQPPFWRSKFLQYLKLPSLMRLERTAAALARKTFVCSESDRRYLSQALRFPRIATIPNSVDIPPAWHCPDAPVFLLVGNYGYGANVVTADYLLARVWPLIRQQVPDARLIIAGKNQEAIGSFREGHEGVEFRGFVDDLAALYRESRVVCCPIQSGSGTRVKIIEGAAHGKAIVSTTLGAEGLDFADGKEIVLRDTPEEFAQACTELIRDVPRCRRIGEAARAKAALLYERSNIMRKVRSEMNC